MAGLAACNHVQEGERRTTNTKPNVVVSDPGSDGTIELDTSLFTNRSLCHSSPP